MARYCPNCGAKQDETSKFCMNCGTPLEPEKKDDVATIQQNTDGMPLKMAASGRDAGQPHGPKHSKKRYITLGIAALVLIGAAGFFVGKQFTTKEDAAPAAEHRLYGRSLGFCRQRPCR